MSEKVPHEEELCDAEFAWLCVKHVKSNAIVIAKNNCMLGMASAQLNRLESLRIAFRKAGEEAKGAALASDAFPFAWKDAVKEVCQTGSGVIVEPGRREYQTQRCRIAATSMGSLSSSRIRDTSGGFHFSLISEDQ